MVRAARSAHSIVRTEGSEQALPEQTQSYRAGLFAAGQFRGWAWAVCGWQFRGCAWAGRVWLEHGVELKRLGFTVIKNALANVMRGGASAVVALALPHYLTRALDHDRFAAWALRLVDSICASCLIFGLQYAGFVQVDL